MFYSDNTRAAQQLCRWRWLDDIIWKRHHHQREILRTIGLPSNPRDLTLSRNNHNDNSIVKRNRSTKLTLPMFSLRSDYYSSRGFRRAPGSRAKLRGQRRHSVRGSYTNNVCLNGNPPWTFGGLIYWIILLRIEAALHARENHLCTRNQSTRDSN